MTTQSKFFAALADIPEADVTSYKDPGAVEQILYRAPVGRTYVRTVKMPPGLVSGDVPLRHDDFDEVVYVLEGEWENLTTGEIFPAGTIAVFPRGEDHGPFRYPQGAVFFEVRHYLDDVAGATETGGASNV